MESILTISTLSDVGQRRSRNEDAIGSDLASGVLVVADGMGGHPAGDMASRFAVEEVLRVFSENGGEPNPEALDPNSSREGGARMVEAVKSADERIRQEGLTNPERSGMGTTLTAFQLDRGGTSFHIGHVGDSRAYRFRNGVLEQLTRDDTWVQSQVEAGRIPPENARLHPWSSLLSQAVGLEPPAEPTFLEGEALPGDVFLLCTDGLMAHMTDDEVQGALSDHLAEGLEATVRALVDQVNEEGGIDNITVGLLRVEFRGPGQNAPR